MQELEDDYEQRLADRVRQLEEKADESRRAAREHAEEIRQVKSKYLTKISFHTFMIKVQNNIKKSYF